MRNDVQTIPPRSAPRRVAVTVFGLVTVTHLGAQLLGTQLLASLTQVLLMPALAAVLVAATATAEAVPRARLVRWALLALGFSWLGDTAPRLATGDLAFLAMVGFFLLAQLVYAAAFWPYRGASILRRPAAIIPYAVAAGVIIGLCAGQAGVLLPAVVVYAAAICVMAVLATGLGVLAGVGAAVFVLSDALIALDAFGVLTLPAQGFCVMATYIGAQWMLVTAIRRRALADPAP